MNINKGLECARNPAEETAQITRFCNNNIDLLSFPHRSIQSLINRRISVLYNDRSNFLGSIYCNLYIKPMTREIFLKTLSIYMRLPC